MDEAISQFISITGSDAEKAKFYVESANGDVQDAVSTFFESENGDGGDGEVTQSGPRTLSGEPAPPMPEGWGTNSNTKNTKSKSSSNKNPSGGGATGSSKFASLSDFRSQGRDDDDDEDDEEGPSDGRDPAHFFTGGERSGLSVQNPDHGRRRGGDNGGAPNVVQDILQRAKEMAQRRAAGEQVDEDDDEDWGEGGPTPTGKGTKAKTNSFKGQGRTLGEASTTESDPTQAESAGSSSIPGGFRLAGEGAKDDGEEGEDSSGVANRRIIFWQDGFQLEDGPLCRYDDPAHAHTLSMINQGAAPLSFLNVRFGQRVNLTVEQKHEKYTPPPPPPMKPFGGEGNRLGSPAPQIATASSSSSTATTSAAPSTSLEVDSSKPTTQIQIRLADGQRVVGRFNLTHTVADVRNYINASHPGMSSRQYVLQESFPPKPISDETQTLEQAGLANAVIIQKWS